MAQPDPAAQRRRLTELARALAETGPALPGTLLERHNRCGKPNCRCKHDPPTLHGPMTSGPARSRARPSPAGSARNSTSATETGPLLPNALAHRST